MSFKISKTIELKPLSKERCLFREKKAQSGRLHKKELIGQMVDWVTKKDFFEGLFKKYLEDVFGEKKDIDEEKISSLIEAIIFEEKHKGRIIFDQFVDEASLNEADRAVYQSWQKRGRFSFFEILDVSLGAFVQVKDLASGENFRVYEHLGSYGMEKGMVIAARLVPYEEETMFTGGMIIPIPKDFAYGFRRGLPHAKDSLISQLDIIKVIYGNKREVSNLDHEEVKKRLSRELKEKKLDLTVDDLERMVQEVIDAERREYGIYSKAKPQIRLSATKTLGDDEVIDQYHRGVHLMGEKKFLSALDELVPLAERLAGLPDPFRWYGNIGACLVSLGKLDLGKRYFRKALELNPHYDTAQHNLANFDQSEIVEFLQKEGYKNLFAEIVGQGGAIDCVGLKDNQLLADMRIFLVFLRTHRVVPTRKHRFLPKKEVLEINHSLTEPDSEVLVFDDKKDKKTELRHHGEWQFPKVNFLRIVALAGGLIADGGECLYISQKGSEFLQKEPGEQLGFLLGTWLIEADWGEFGQSKRELSSSWVNDLIKLLAPDLLVCLSQSKKGLVEVEEFLKETVREPDPKEEGAVMVLLLPIFLKRILLDKLVWMGMITSEEDLYQTKSVRLTKFGRCVLKQIESQAEKAVSALAFLEDFC